MPGQVSEELCQSRMETINTKLDAIQRNGEEARTGVGKIMRRLFEGNGGEALDVQVHKNSEFRLSACREAEIRKSQHWRARLSWSLAIAGWVFALIVLALQWRGI